MTPDRHAQVKAIFLDVVAHPPEEWNEALTRCCDDDDIRKEVKKLLDNHTTTNNTDETITSSNQETVVSNAAMSKPVRANDYHAGQTVGERYRIVTLLGRGGMGEVYQAEDLMLGITVALKFLSPRYSNDVNWCRRFQAEVRNALKITHPNVCRVYDIGEMDGKLFLSMEYVAGDDLQSLLRRIGRFSADKSVDLARQICIGLAAAHDAGILHRDLKPANIMVDKEGMVRITDFGLAALPEEVLKEEIGAGTPAYMAPEQITGKEVSTRSDIYALGLVLYEIFCGKPAFDAESFAGYRQLHQQSRPKAPSDMVHDIDADVERVIMRCLSKDPSERPDSVLSVAAALPGQNVLAMALAANVMPSPTMVEKARPMAVGLPKAGLLFAIAFTLLVAYFGIRTAVPPPWQSALTKSPEVLAERAVQLLNRIGVTGTGASYGFVAAAEAQKQLQLELRSMQQSLKFAEQAGVIMTPANAVRLATDAPLVFWYRRAEKQEVPRTVEALVTNAGRVSFNDPPIAQAESSVIALDPNGTLLFYDGSLGNCTREELKSIIDEASRLEAANEGEETNDGTVTADSSYISLPSLSDVSLARVAKGNPASTVENDDIAFRLLILMLSLCAMPLAFRHARDGISDFRGASRLAAGFFLLGIMTYVLRRPQLVNLESEVGIFTFKLVFLLGVSTLVAILYVALEPIARRYWPEMLVTWSRLVAGQFNDQFVARDTMVGIAVGCAWGLMAIGEVSLAQLAGWEQTLTLHESIPLNLLEGRLLWGGVLDIARESLLRGLLFLLLLALLRAWSGSARLAAILSVILLAVVIVPRGSNLVSATLIFGLLVLPLAVWVMVRLGLLALTVALFTTFVISRLPCSFQFDHWTGDTSLGLFVLLSGMLLYGLMYARENAAPRTQS
ncbi:MAG: serine/threonine-protein kinase [Phycisphaerae bacterium]